MKIAITSTGRTLDSEVYQRFGRAPWLLIVDTANGRAEAVEINHDAGAEQSAGIQIAQKVVEFGARVVLTGHCGPRSFAILREAGVFVFAGVEGTAAEALAWHANGFLVPSGVPDMEPHWT